MAPNTSNGENDPIFTKESLEKLVPPRADSRKSQIVYFNLLTFGYWHLAGLYGLYLCFTSAKWATILFAILMYLCANIGITGAAHRLWSHKSYKAKLPLQIILMVFHTLSFQNTVFTWVRDHRLHHKFSDTDADPHNATRGFFFSHIGWLLVKKHPEVIKRGKNIDMSDIYSNPVLRFQKKYATPFITTVAFLLPTIIPMYCWGESLNNSWHIALLRIVTNLHATFLVNSAAHMWGYKPYDKNINPTMNHFCNITTLGEGFHNYHHAFPSDYRAAELGNDKWNLTTKFIDFFAWIGWAYGLNTASEAAIKRKVARTGDGTHPSSWDINLKGEETDVILHKKQELNY